MPHSAGGIAVVDSLAAATGIARDLMHRTTCCNNALNKIPYIRIGLLVIGYGSIPSGKVRKQSLRYA